jgi:predicted metal-dependent hydrolase
VPARIRRWLETEALRLLARTSRSTARSPAGPCPSCACRARSGAGAAARAKGCIRINWRLVQAPDCVRRSVVAHEVAHLVHFDHSPAFRALLAALFEGDLDRGRRLAAAEGRGLYAAFG